MVDIDECRFQIGEVRRADAFDTPCLNPRALFNQIPQTGPVELIFRKINTAETGTDVVEVKLCYAGNRFGENLDPGSISISGDVIGRYGGDTFVLGGFRGSYHPERQTGQIWVKANVPPRP